MHAFSFLCYNIMMQWACLFAAARGLIPRSSRISHVNTIELSFDEIRTIRSLPETMISGFTYLNY